MSEAAPNWQILIHRQPEKALRRLSRDLRQRIRLAIWKLAENPKPPGCRKLVGYDNLYRIRVGDWRISYAIEEDKSLVVIVEIAPRGRAYRHLD